MNRRLRQKDKAYFEVLACGSGRLRPTLRRVHGPHRDAFMEAAGGEDVVELIVACRLWVLTREVVRHDVAGVLGFTRRRRLCLPTIRRLGAYELQPNGCHPLKHRPVACLPVRISAIAIPMRNIEITGGQDAIRLRILVADECREVRDYAVDGGVRAKAPRSLDVWVRSDPPGVHGDGDERPESSRRAARLGRRQWCRCR